MRVSSALEVGGEKRMKSTSRLVPMPPTARMAPKPKAAFQMTLNEALKPIRHNTSMYGSK